MPYLWHSAALAASIFSCFLLTTRQFPSLILICPHQPINLYKPADFDANIVLVRDEEKCLPNLTITLEEYQKQLNSTLKKGNIVSVANQFRHGERSKYGSDYYVRFDGKSYTIKRPKLKSYKANDMPVLVRVDRVAKDKSYVVVSWPQEYDIWDRYYGERIMKYRSREKVSITFVLNASAYTPGDFRMFMCDRALKGKYLSWASLLLPCEGWYNSGKKDVEDDKDRD